MIGNPPQTVNPYTLSPNPAQTSLLPFGGLPGILHTSPASTLGPAPPRGGDLTSPAGAPRLRSCLRSRRRGCCTGAGRRHYPRRVRSVWQRAAPERAWLVPVSTDSHASCSLGFLTGKRRLGRQCPNPGGGAASGPEAPRGPEGRTVRASERPWETGGPARPQCRPAPWSVLSPPGLSSSLSASKIRSRPHVSRGPPPVASPGSAMTGVARATCDLLKRLEADRPRRHVACGRYCACARRWGWGHRCGRGRRGRGQHGRERPFVLTFSPSRSIALEGGGDPQLTQPAWMHN